MGACARRKFQRLDAKWIECRRSRLDRIGVSQRRHASVVRAMESNHADKSDPKENDETVALFPINTTKLPITSEINLTEDTLCGVWLLKGPFLQKFANKKAYVIIYGLLGCTFSAASAYFNGTITTLEKRFKIPSRTVGVISVGNDLSQLLVSVILSYYASRGHRPRWMAVGMYTVVLACLLSALPHFLYGAGGDALALTQEHKPHGNNLTNVFERQQKKILCHQRNITHPECERETGNYSPQLILFVAQFISGIGGSLYYTLGVAYMDDNVKKSKTPALFGFSFCIRMLGPAIGYTLASVCLKLYISPILTPTIENTDPRWIGAWWLGWLILALFIFLISSLLALFPKTLPRAAVRRETTKRQAQNISNRNIEPELQASFKDMIKTFKRLLSNITLMLNSFAAVFYFLGYLPYWIFLPKYIETQYRQSASVSSLITGSAGLVFSAIGVLLSGLIISKFRPRARYLAGWNVIVGVISVLAIVSFAYLGCKENDNRISLLPNGQLNPVLECNVNCNCDYVKYNPVCAEDKKTTFISACHAGCRKMSKINETIMFSDCSCINRNTTIQALYLQKTVKSRKQASLKEPPLNEGGFALSGNCHADCLNQFYVFLAVLCLLKFAGATGKASNLLVVVRCVDEKDKSVAMGFGLMLISLCAFVPSPILFGTIIDKTCLVWGKTCTGNGNCWLYNGESLRYSLNFSAAFFVLIGALLDCGVWYFVKELKIFDEEVEIKEDATPN